MKRHAARLLALFLTVMLTLGLLPGVSFAADIVASGNCGGEGDGSNLTWALDSEGTLTISGTGEMNAWDGLALPPWYNNREAVIKVILPIGLTSIGRYAFYGCGNLTSVTIPESVTIIDEWAFEGCSRLTSVTIPDGVRFIGTFAFKGCGSMRSVSIPNSVTVIGWGSFAGCEALREIAAAEGNTAYTVENGVLFTKDMSILVQYPAGKLTDSYVIPAGVTNINRNAFEGCSRLTGVTIPASVTGIGISAFEGCSSLTSVEIPGSVTSVESHVFYGCSSLASVTIPESVTIIGHWAFRDCSSLTSVTIPNRVTSIGEYAFKGCSSLTSATIPKSVTSIDGGSFAGCAALKELTVADGNTAYTAQNGVLFTKNLSTLVQYPAGKEVGSYTVPENVTNINRYAFEGCGSLTSVTIPNCVTSIGEYVFRDCSSLTSATIPESVTRGLLAPFAGCAALREIAVAEGNTGYTAENGVLFLKDMSVLVQYPMGKEAGSYAIPDGVADIWPDAFSNCSSLTSVSIPVSVTMIRKGAFDACTALTDVYYAGTGPQWAAIIGIGKPSGEGITIHFNSTGPAAVPGDVSGDGVVDILDVRALFAAVSSSAASTTSADLNGDGKLTNRDTILLFRRLAKGEQ